MKRINNYTFQKIRIGAMEIHATVTMNASQGIVTIKDCAITLMPIELSWAAMTLTLCVDNLMKREYR